MTWYFVDEEGDTLGIPKLWRLYFLDIYLGDMGIPKLELLSILHLITSSFSPTLENSLHTKHHTIFISNVSVIKIIKPLGLSFNTSITSIWDISYGHNFFLKLFDQKNIKQKEIKRQMQIMAEICQNRTTGKDRFIWKSAVAQIKKCKTNKS